MGRQIPRWRPTPLIVRPGIRSHARSIGWGRPFRRHSATSAAGQDLAAPAFTDEHPRHDCDQVSCHPSSVAIDSAAARCMVSVTWEYRSRVIATVACPSISLATLG